MIDTYTVVQLLAWLAVGLIMFLAAATICFDFGAGMLARFVGKNEYEKRAVINIVAPTWDGNQVWLITAGAGLFAIWPRVYAGSFSGMYLGILVVLWALFLRPVAFEYRHKIHSLKWTNFWDWMLCIGSLVPILVIGVAIGNLFIGLPFGFDPGTLRFYYGSVNLPQESALISLLGLLNPFAIAVGVMAVILSIMHGASYCAMRTEGVLYARFVKIQKLSIILFIILFALVGIWLSMLQGYHWALSDKLSSYSQAVLHPLTGGKVTITTGGWLSNYAHHTWMIIAPVLGFLGAICAYLFAQKHKATLAFFSSVLSCFGVVFSLGFSLFPFIMPSSILPEQSFVIWNSSSSLISLIGILIVAVIMLPIIFVYTTYVYKKMWGRGVTLTPEEVKERSHELY
ncbi:cytochrome d ubiquinol oxidase subunit II [Fangia hongkongensis]|uniref:cytochrome d ubiquinol oxidase subunit II n=1 Tax=Fangia hongkongensis TaxID=270495 RepID=UPI0003825BD9|nr:cytochrome d ubiquinol oxidase subunit II [Fangia hongkongensis]MBK2126212.1 cytochrome d ubiquinol oxidase subunit II [Fangia hongkongensis]